MQSGGVCHIKPAKLYMCTQPSRGDVPVMVLYPWTVTWPRGYKTFFMLNSNEHEIFPAH